MKKLKKNITKIIKEHYEHHKIIKDYHKGYKYHRKFHENNKWTSDMDDRMKRIIEAHHHHNNQYYSGLSH